MSPSRRTFKKSGSGFAGHCPGIARFWIFAMRFPARRIRYGDLGVPVLVRGWTAAPRQPYRKTYRLTPGQHWSEAPISERQWENYVLLPDGQAVPVGALLADELRAEGASSAVFTELWAGRCVLVGPDLVCVREDGALGELLAKLRAAAGGSLGGLPDVIGLFRDGRVVMREAKNVSAHDRIGRKQHRFARLARELLGQRLDLAVVEWGRAL